jgi:histidine triad (HIT) family protein
MASIFTRILEGEIPCEKILESEYFFAFLDVRPISPGHTLVIPKLEVDNLFDLGSEYLQGMLPFAKPIAKALAKSVPCRRIGLMVAGFQVPHAHLHLVPIQEEGDLSFSNARPAGREELAHLGRTIRAALEQAESPE